MSGIIKLWKAEPSVTNHLVGFARLQMVSGANINHNRGGALNLVCFSLNDIGLHNPAIDVINLMCLKINGWPKAQLLLKC